MSKQTLKFLLIFLLSAVFVQAQEVQQLPKHPGDVIKFSIKFDGVDANKITAVYPRLWTNSQPQVEQAGFVNAFNSSDFRLISPGNFEIQLTIPENAVSGEYVLNMDVRAGTLQLSYSDGQQYHMRPIRVENERKFVQPGVQVAELR